MGKVVITLVIIASLLGGCAHKAELAHQSIISTRNDVFQEIPSSGGQGMGMTTLKITASLKTHKPGMYAFDVQTHGTPDYRLVINIDGQSLRLTGNPRPESTDQTLARRPEEGEGIRYRFQTVLKISGGPHRIIAALPDDGVAIDRTVTLEGGKENILLLEPIYGSTKIDRKPAILSGTSFMEGVRGFILKFNGKGVE